MIKYRQEKLKRNLFKDMILSYIVIALIMSISLVGISQKNKSEDETLITNHESVNDYQETVVSSANVPEEEVTYPIHNQWDPEETYLLAKIAMAEAEGESLETKVLVILTVLNRVHSSEFPNTIEQVIFQQKNGVYQFTCIADGRWGKVEPNHECWEAIQVVSALPNDISEGALYFEACKGETWHSRNLQFIRQSGATKFYK